MIGGPSGSDGDPAAGEPDHVLGSRWVSGRGEGSGPAGLGVWWAVVARVLAVAPVVLCAACSLVLDPGNLPPQTDAQAIDAPVIIDPSLLHIDSVAPMMIPEGAGTGGSRRALIVVTGVSLLPDGVVTAELMGPTPSRLPFTRSASFDGKKAGLAVEVPVMGDCSSGSRTIRITWTQGAASQSTEAVKVQCLPELTSAPVGPLAPLYSRVVLDQAAAIHLGGAAPIRIEAVADVVLRAPLDVDASGVDAGAYGCAGGAPSNPGSCGAGGGKPGQNGAGLTAAGGGGGGGFGGPGRDGEAPSGTGGAPTGSDTLVPLDDGGNRGNGGGGGGKSTANRDGGPGGGGGGVIYLRANGDLTVGDIDGHRGAISARGGDGPSVGPALTPGGGGGGGSGGAILVRVGGMITARAGWLTAPGGTGALKGAGMWATQGGDGGVGRVRIDAAEGAVGSVAAMATSATTFRGPAWDKDTPWLVDVEATAPPLVLRGQPGRAFGLRVNDTALAAMATPGPDGSVMLGNLPLVRGANKICAVAEPMMLQPESLSCIDVFYTGR